MKSITIKVISATVISIAAVLPPSEGAEQKKIQVGIIHSLTGTMAVVETGLVEAEMMAIAEINATGGIRINNQQYLIQPILKDAGSIWQEYTQQANDLINRNKVAALFGGWTSASRKAMLPVVEAKDHLLFYPISYEGQECSRNIFYTGATPNQQSEPAILFMHQQSPAAGKPFFLVGSDYVFPRTSHVITKEQLKALGASVVGEQYLPLGNIEVGAIIEMIKASMPNGGVIINHFNGDQNVAFFRELRANNLTPDNGYYVMSFTLLGPELELIGRNYLAGHYVSWNYMMSDQSRSSQTFIRSFQQRYGAERWLTDPQESAYTMVYLWKKAVEKAQSFDPAKVRQALVGVTFQAPQGKVEVMPNHHLAQSARIAQITPTGSMRIVAESKSMVQPHAWSRYEPVMRGHACDWTDPSKGERYRF